MEDENTKLLAGCVIIYNPNAFVIENIKSYLKHLDVLYVIDNSEIINIDFATYLRSISRRIAYIPQNKNIGMASALNIGARAAFEANYNWLLTMDQDSYFPVGKFFHIWNTDIVDFDQIGLLAASYTTKYDRWQKNHSDHFNEIHFAITSGNIINLTAWNYIRGFEDKLFIDEVDHDYCLKLRKYNYMILTSKEKLMEHVIGEYYETGSSNIVEKKKIILHNPARYYYMSRNVLYLCKKYFFVDLKFVLARLYYLIKIFAKIIFIYPAKISYLKFFFKGIRDFTLSKYDKL